MKLTLKPVDIPFMVGDLVWISQPCGDANTQPYFQGQIIQIILDGSLKQTTVIRQRKELHELIISSVVYDLRPVGDHAGEARVCVKIELFSTLETLFTSREALLASQVQ